MSSLSTTLGKLLLSYVGPEPERVRTAIALLARDDAERMRHFLECAATDYRDVLWWAEQDKSEAERRSVLGGMTVNERLSHLSLLSAWDAAIAARDTRAAEAILSQCAIPNSDAAKIVEATIGRA
jgi:hypothetical protein